MRMTQLKLEVVVTETVEIKSRATRQVINFQRGSCDVTNVF